MAEAATARGPSAGRVVIRTPDQRLRVFISSTLGELAEERRLARAAVEGLRLTPVMFELGARPHPPRALYRAYLWQSHVFVGIYWQRYGWIAPEETVSGVEDEYDLSGDRPKLIYVKEAEGGREPRLEALLARVERDDRASYKRFSGPEELGRLLGEDLATLLSERFESSRADASDWEESTHARLPEPTTTFVGREAAIHAVRALLREPGTRMLTLTGPGGIGKTRLALQVARGLHHRFRDGVVPVFLGALADPGQVAPAIANALGLPETPGVSRIDTLVRYLQARRLLLVLDNFEHVISAAPELTTLLAACPCVRMLVTSRERLKVSGERGYEVPPLEVSAAETGARRAAPSEAARLFAERAGSALPGFALTPENARIVSEICRKLEGLPLALELAAARVRVLPLEELAAHLEDRLALLVHGPRDVPERHRTLRAALEWSHDLLGDPDRRLFARLAVFRGGWTLSDAEAVCGPDLDVLDGLSSLLDKSLVRSSASGSAGPIRFLMLETIREFALEQLRKAGEEDQLRARHAQYFLEWNERSYAGYQVEGIHQQALWIRRIDEQAENLRAAMRWLADAGRWGSVSRMGLTLWRYWWVRTESTAAAAWMQEVLASPSLDAQERAQAQLVLGMADVGRSDYERALPSLEAAHAALERLGDHEHAALAAVLLGAGVALTRDVQEGERVLLRALTTFRRRDDVWGTAFAMFALGLVLLMQGRLDEAIEAEQEGAASLRAAGELVLRGMILVSLGWMRVARGRLERATEALEEALEIVTTMQDRDGMARVFDALAAVVLHRGDPRVAARLFGAAEGVRRSVGGRIWVIDRVLVDGLELELRRRLGERELEAACAEGSALPTERAIHLARAAAAGATPLRPEAISSSAGVER